MQFSIRIKDLSAKCIKLCKEMCGTLPQPEKSDRFLCVPPHKIYTGD